MNTDSSAERRLRDLGIQLPAPPEPFGTYVEGVQTGNLLFLTGMLPTEGHEAKFIGRVGAELDVEAGRKAARIAALNVLAVARQHLGSLDKITRIVRLGVSVATSRDVRDQPKVADARSELLHAGTIALNSTLLFSIGFATGHLEGQERINVFLSIPLLCLVTLSICPFVP